MSIYLVYALSLLLVLLIVRQLFKRSYIYYYNIVEKRIEKVLLGYIRHDGTIIDIHRPKLDRVIGQVIVRNNKAIVRIFDRENEQDYKEVGYVTAKGEIFFSMVEGEDKCIAIMDANGKTNWWELWLRRHADVCLDEENPLGHCIETGRFHIKRPNEISLLSRAGAVLLLYFNTRKISDEETAILPEKIWDTALTATLIYVFFFSLFRIINKDMLVFPFLGSHYSQIISLTVIFFLIWLFLHLVKQFWLSGSDTILEYLSLINRNTGLVKWNTAGIFLAIVGILWSIYVSGYSLFPLYFVILIGLGVNSKLATSAPWAVSLPFRTDMTLPNVISEGKETKSYRWALDSTFRNLQFHLDISFDKDEISKVRKLNPFYKNWQVAASQWNTSVEQIVLEGVKDVRLKRVAYYCEQQFIDHMLTKIEQIQLVLDFVQEPNIKYKKDEECSEIKNTVEYVRFPVETLFDKQGDCDCKATLAAALFKLLDFSVIMVVTKTHAAIAVQGSSAMMEEQNLDAVYNWKGKLYYYCETTGENWTVGLLPGNTKAILDKEKIDIIDFSRLKNDFQQ